MRSKRNINEVITEYSESVYIEVLLRLGLEKCESD